MTDISIKNQRSRAWQLTKHCEEFKESDIEVFREPSTYSIFGKEIAPTTGQKHWQGYVYLKNQQRGSYLIKLLPGAHIEVARGDHEQNRAYCSKGEDYIEYGIMPISRRPENQGTIAQTRWREAEQAAREGRMQDIPRDMYTRYYAYYDNLFLRHGPRPANLEGCCGVWVFGPSGVGKSHVVRDTLPKHFNKMKNKWWDGFDPLYHDSIIIEEVDREDIWMWQHLKIWADKYPFTCEIKNSVAFIRPKKVVVISNFSIEECIQEPRMLEAIKQRFHVVQILGESRRPTPGRFVVQNTSQEDLENLMKNVLI